MKAEITAESAVGKVNVLLLEGIGKAAVEIFEAQGYQVETHSGSMSAQELEAKLGRVNILGIRSKTQITRQLLGSAKNLWAIGCFCIGVNQIDQVAASEQGIIVFNSPYCNSRSVAELIIGEMIMLLRQLYSRTSEMHQGIWNKTSLNSHEIRGKTVGIVGYGHVGSQLSILAEAIGMNVLFYDIAPIMPIGLAKSMPTLKELLMQSDFVTLHVPETPTTREMLSFKEIALMKPSSFLLNASRGSVVNLEAVDAALQSGHLLGAAIDVYSEEPTAKKTHDFKCLLQNRPNCILTPHIGGSTVEAQRGIAIEVAQKLCKYVQRGCTFTCLNFPEVDLAKQANASAFTRLIVIHRNVPGVLKGVNQLLEVYNVERQTCDSKGEHAILVVDVNANLEEEETLKAKNEEQLLKIVEEIKRIPEVIRTLILKLGDE
jgi:D-3-phosphoglycerate dehydrogenase